LIEVEQQSKDNQALMPRKCDGRLDDFFEAGGHEMWLVPVADHVWLISFMHYDLGFFDDQSCRVECAPNPFGAKVLPMSPE
jgi:hypothetical protein